MPLYDYACRVCDNSFEIRQSYQEEPLTECPRCHGEIRRVINQVGLVFKGGGYYITDSRPAGASGSDSPSSRAASSTARPARQLIDHHPVADLQLLIQPLGDLIVAQLAATVRTTLVALVGEVL